MTTNNSPAARTALLTTLAMLAFAANSVLCRKALSATSIDPATFTLVRIASGALLLGVVARVRLRGKDRSGGTWAGALALVGYAAFFSFAYLSLPAGTGALLLFGAVQATMISAALLRGERLRPFQWAGLLLALGGLVGLVSPGLTAPDPLGALMMAAAGLAWGLYSLLGRGGKADPTAATAGNFRLGVLPASAIAVAAFFLGGSSWDLEGVAYAALSGALASGIGYAIWYAALPGLTAASAATVQLSVPVITALGGMVLLSEPLTMRLALCSLAILGGIALVVRANRR
jgi:drug/metabolite transporter (DMT)-like permease